MVQMLDPTLLRQAQQRIDEEIQALVPSASSARCAALEFLQRLAHVESTQLVTNRLQSILTASREDGSNLQRDVAAVALFRTLQRVSRFCAEFAKVVSTSTTPLFQDALTTIQRFESGFVEPVRTAVAFDERGRIGRLRSGLSQVWPPSSVGSLCLCPLLGLGGVGCWPCWGCCFSGLAAAVCRVENDVFCGAADGCHAYGNRCPWGRLQLFDMYHRHLLHIVPMCMR